MSTKRNGRRNNGKDEGNIPEADRNRLQNCFSEFVESGQSQIEIANLTNVQRKYAHSLAGRMGLKTRSHGHKNNRVLHVTQPKHGHKQTLLVVPKLVLKAGTSRLLADQAEALQAHLDSTIKLLEQPAPPHPIKQSRSRGEALLLVGMGSRMIPPRPNRISNELYHDKQELPIFRYQDEINKMLAQHSIFIINGETGSGKTTQVPQYILSECNKQNKSCRVIVSEPRRIAAVASAQRVAEERGEQLGDTVGYQIRMESRVRKTTNLIYTTSGCLLRAIMSDAQFLFRKVTHLIIDEIHERDKYTDFTLITVKEQLKNNKNLKIILMSATMDINLLSQYFDECPVLNVPGQGFDVKIYHLEDILYHTGYRTALMEKYLHSLGNSTAQQSTPAAVAAVVNEASRITAGLVDEYVQEMLDNLLDTCTESSRSEEELNEVFDQIQYYIDSEGISINVAHSRTAVTPLIAACKCNSGKYAQLFLMREADVNVRDAQGLSAIDYASLHADGVCLELLGRNANTQESQLNHIDAEKQRLLTAYHQQFNDDNEVDHDLILSLLEGLYRSDHPGAIMVFLPGYNDIVQQRDLINSTLPAGTYRICILHGQMDSHDNYEALQVHRVRKIILSTNIGQTSITIPDLAYIIDSGKVKMKTYDSITESSQLQSVWISKADANQRSGRSGRTQNGVCYRLYSLPRYQFMPEFCVPEFMRIPLTEICLYAKTLDKLCNVQTYLSRSLNPPSAISVQNAIHKLQILKIFTDDECVTELGKHLVELPLDVQLGKCLLYGMFFKCIDPVLTVVAFHSVKDPFILPTDRAVQGQASFQRKSLAGQSFSDQMGVLSLYKDYMLVRQNRKRARDFCNKYFLSQSAMEIFCATRRQLAEQLAQRYLLGAQATLFNSDWHMVRLCLVAGFYPNVAVIDRSKNALISGMEKQLVLQRTSALNPPGMKNLKDFVAKLPHDWIIFFEKSRLNSLCSINMNTVVPPLTIMLQCGRNCIVEDEVDATSDATASESDDDVEADSSALLAPQKQLKALRLREQGASISLMLDNWIKFELPSSTDANNLLLVRDLIQHQFLAYLRFGKPGQCTIAQYVQKLLAEEEHVS